MELSKNFIPADAERKWTAIWKENKYFNSLPDSRKAFTVVIPPPNVTGVLHMGHTLNETVQDILARRARMSGYNTCWVPGSDHASIATEAKVVQMLKEKGIDKNSISREKFLQYAFEWKEKYGGIIYNQIERLGCSVDWERVTFTMDEHYYKAVIKTFVDLYNKGLIYRGARMINWDPAAQTALSDEEVEYKDITGKLFYVKYTLANDASENRGEDALDYVVVATSRPETIMGDVAICVNPNDERYMHLKGKKVLVPLINREIPVIFDEYIDMSFGTGVLKVTPAHDINDYNLGIKHHLEVIDTLNADGTLSKAAQIFVGEDRFVARKKIVEALAQKNLLVKEEGYPSRLGYSQRSGAVVEPRISTQWFLKMQSLAAPALKAVVDGDIKIHPGDKFLATYKHWLENVKDWCISRQLWWGQQIPAWYDDAGNVFVAETEEEAKRLKQNAESIDNSGVEHSAFSIQLTRDNDVLDTWFSSWLWPMEVFNGISQPNNADLKYYYPTSVLVTGQDIIFFWVARMVMAGLEYEKTIPFRDVYFTGMVRDKLGRKMSKSLGNSPDLLNLIDVYGADAVRFGIMIASPAGNDLLFDEAALEQGRNFNNKIWNALKLVKMWEEKVSDREDIKGESISVEPDTFAINWFENRLNQAKKEVAQLHAQFKLSEGLKTIYSLIWDDFCSWYLEWIKPSNYAGDRFITPKTYQKTIYFFEELLQLLHPYMPFVTEEIYHLLKEQKDDLCVKQFAEIGAADETILQRGEWLKAAITAVRDLRNKNNVKPKELLPRILTQREQPFDAAFGAMQGILVHQVNAQSIGNTDVAPENCAVVTLDKDKIYVELPYQQVDKAAQKADLLKDLEYQQKFLESVQKKLSNERFIQNAKPEVVAIERKKQSDAEARIKAIEDSLKNLIN